MSGSKILRFAGWCVFNVAVVAFIIIVFVFAFRTSNSSTDSKGSRIEDSLKFIFVVSRHGNRGGFFDYPGDPYPNNDTTYWPYGVEGLTPVGRKQMYKLGKRVRSLYNGFLNTTFHTEEMHASSTYMDRILMSGELFLAGLYPPKGFQVWDKDVAWQPSPLYSDSPDKTTVVNDCPEYLVVLNDLKDYYGEVYAANLTYLIDYYNNLTGSTDTGVQGASNIFDFWDKLVSEETEGYTIPEWTRELYPEKMKSMISLEYIIYCGGSEEIIRLIAGTMFREMADVMEAVVNGSLTDRRLQYYSGHDMTVVALQMLLGISESDVVALVKPASALVLELHHNSSTDQYSLQAVFIDGGTDDLELVTLTLPNCGDPCDYQALINNTAKYTDIDYDQVCENTTSATTSYFHR